MEKVNIAKIAIVSLLAVLLVAMALAPACAKPAPAPAPTPAPTPVAKVHKPVELRFWTPFPLETFPGLNGKRLMDNINKYGKDVNITVKYIGGPEVFPGFAGLDPLLDGLVDITYQSGGYYAGLIPEEMASHADMFPLWESLERGTVDVMNKFYEPKGVYLLGWSEHGYKFQGYMRVKREKPDLSGLSIRSYPVYDPVIKALGGTPITIGMGEVYTALERGTCDGAYWTDIGLDEWGWHENLKYIWGPGILSVPGPISLSLDVWNALDKDQQAALKAILKETVYQNYIVTQKETKATEKRLLDYGLEKITFSEADAEFYTKTARDEFWKYVLEIAPAAAELRPLMTR